MNPYFHMSVLHDGQLHHNHCLITIVADQEQVSYLSNHCGDFSSGIFFHSGIRKDKKCV